ncbi:PKD domain-containing protein [Desulfocastanea catecholica]
MKNNILSLLLILIVLPTVSLGAQMRNLEIEFAFKAPDDPVKQVLGYRLYKEGKQVCETNEPNVFKMNCALLLEEDTHGFTLAAYYSNETESPRSAPFEFAIPPTQSIHFNWNYIDSAKNAGGFRLYDNGVLIYETSDFSTRQLAYESEVSSTQHKFTISAVDAKGGETSLLPDALTYTVVTEPIAILSSSTATGTAPLTVNFDGSSSQTPNAPFVSYTWTFGDGSVATGKTASHVFTKAGTYYTQLTVKDSKGLTNSISTPIVVSPPNVENATDSSSPLPDFELGEVSIDHEWTRVLFENTFNEPVVVAGPPTSIGSHPVLVRVRNIDRMGFEIRLQEWDYLDGAHTPEIFSYIVMEKGTYSLNDGTKIEAGNFTGSNQFKNISLQQSYNLTPIILTQVISNNDIKAVTGRVGNINQLSFEYKLQEQETTAFSHGTETIGYIAWEPGEGTLPGLQYEAGTKSITQTWSTLTFNTTFSDMPFFIAGMQTYNGSDPAAVRTQNMSQSAIKVKIEEEQSKDAEIYHKVEEVGYLVIGSAE